MASSSPQPVLPPLLDQVLHAPADPQAASPLFARLPIEIRRMIYVEVWRTYGAPAPDGGSDEGAAGMDDPEWWWRAHGGSLAVHIAPVLATGRGSGSGTGLDALLDGAGFTSTPCFLGVDDDEVDTTAHTTPPPPPPEARGIRPDRPASTALVLRSQVFPVPLPQTTRPRPRPRPAPATPPAADTEEPYPVWRRLDSPWLAHWPCEAYFTGASRDSPRRVHQPPRPYLPLLRTCRRAYAEAGPLLYRALTFQFVDDDRTALAFARRWPAAASVRLVRALRPADLAAHSAGIGRRGDADAARQLASTAADATAWRQLLARLADPAAMPLLRRLRIWVETADGRRPWHQVGAETRLFAPLLGAQHLLARRGGVVLYLPTLPDNQADRQLPAWCFLGEDDDTDDGADTTTPSRPVPRPIVVRTPRYEGP